MPDREAVYEARKLLKGTQCSIQTAHEEEEGDTRSPKSGNTGENWTMEQSQGARNRYLHRDKGPEDSKIPMEKI